MSFVIRVSALLMLLSLLPVKATKAEVDFVKEIQPILKSRCYDCHGGETREAGLRLDQKADALAGGDSGQAIKPGDAAASLLVKLISGEDEDRLMPPDGDNLTPDEIAKIEAWIDEGANWPDGVDPKKVKTSHWAYQPLSFSLPESEDFKNKAPIDRFILAKLQEQGIEPSPIADRYTLIKRLYYDLIGLPPSISDVDSFASDDTPDAYEKVVDRLLASKHFGERWGRHWLDKARYADSDGYEKDRPRYNAWKYRDWVIDAINEDKPFDQFTIEQIAGDQLTNRTAEQLLATAFHRQTLTNTEGGTDKEEFRVAAVFDRVETIGSVWLGLTVGCARCHSHKYDEISQREYYQLFAFFNNGDESTTKMPTSLEAHAKYQTEKAKHDEMLKQLQTPLTVRRAELQKGFDEWLDALQARFETQGIEQKSEKLELKQAHSQTGKLENRDDGSLLAVGDQGVMDVYSLTYQPITEEPFAIAGIKLEALTDKSFPKNGPGRSSGGNFVLSEITADLVDPDGNATRRSFASATADFSQDDYGVEQAIDGAESTKGWAISPQMGKPHTATFQFKKTISSEELAGGELLIRLSQQYSASLHTLGRFRIAFLSPAGAELADLPGNVKAALQVKAEKRSKEQKEALFQHFASLDEEYRELKTLVEAHQKKVPFNPEMVVRVVNTRANNPRQTRILKRGDFQQPLGPVQAGTLETLPFLEIAIEENPTRLDFAKWLVSGDNPLPPRVFVNQIWSHLFGSGIVGTVNDFGVRGDSPSHPELLDWLAAHLIEHGWSRKQLVKTILMSETYRRSSVHRPELADVDPTNKLLYRQNRFRVEAEIIRDLYLAASGLLEPRIGGPSVFPPLPADVAAVSYANNFKWGNSDWNTRPDRPHGVAPKEDIYRRGMYTFFKRTAAHPNLVTFDCPDSNTTCVDRGTSNTPLQALQTLNNNVFVDASRAMANRILNDETLSTNRQRAAQLLRICVARKPSQDEVLVLEQLRADADAYFRRRPEQAKELAELNEDEQAIQLAPWVAMARTVMNLDEFMTRE